MPGATWANTTSPSGINERAKQQAATQPPPPCRLIDLQTHLPSAREAPAENDDRLAVHSRVGDLFPVAFGAGDASMLDGQ